MMKRKFGDGLRSKTDVAMVNETLCKVHNLVALIHEMYELGIEPVVLDRCDSQRIVSGEGRHETSRHRSYRFALLRNLHFRAAK